MTDELLDLGILGSAAKERVEPMADENETTLILAEASAADAIEFAQGALDAVCAICAALIGRGLVEPTAFQADMERYSKHWRKEGRPTRASATEIVRARLQTIERGKLKTNAHLVLPDSPRIN
jgi:hypothetical protein